MDGVLVLWDIDGTLLSSDGVGRDLYGVVFARLFGRSLEAFAPMAGRTDRSIILQTLAMAGVPEPRRHVESFIAGMSAQAPLVHSEIAARGQALPGAAAVLAALAALAAPTVPAGADQTAAGQTAASQAAASQAAAAGLAWHVRQSVLTGNIRSIAEVKLAALGLGGPLDLGIGAYGDDHEVRAELVRVARRRAGDTHGRSPSDFAGTRTVVVGDTPLDVEAALVTGARAVGVATGAFSAADLTAAGAHAVLPDLTDTAAVLRTLLPGG